MRLLYKITDQMFLHFYTFNVEKVRKCFTFLFLLYLFFFFNCSYCEYSVQYEQNNEQATFSDSSLKEQKRYNLSELSGDNTLKNEEKILESEELTQKQKKLIIAGAFFVLCVTTLLVIITLENEDLQKRVHSSEKNIEFLWKLAKKSNPRAFEPSPSTSAQSGEEWQRPDKWQYGFGF